MRQSSALPGARFGGRFERLLLPRGFASSREVGARLRELGCETPGAWGQTPGVPRQRSRWRAALVPCSRGHRSPSCRPARPGAGPARRAGRVRLAHRRRHRALRRQGLLAEEARGFVLRERQSRPQERGARRAGRVDRADRGRQRERGAAARAAADQAPPAAAQRAAARRQVVSVHRGHAAATSTRACCSRASGTAAACATSGPYASAQKVRTTLETLNKIFPYRPCEGPAPGRRSGVPCLDYHIGRCAAPCVGLITREDYRAVIDDVIAFLEGRTNKIERDLERRMHEASERAPVRGGRAHAQPADGRAPPQRAPGGVGRDGHLRRRRARGRGRRRQRAAARRARRAHRGAPLALPRERRRARARTSCSRASCSTTTTRRSASRR